ncbi:hypothetical protein [Sphingobacterium faecale]|uniref:Uncharacterized protein n=1 Tax=Sphingobacterium faecale TaxID=2803775 RepID=A0ABS1R3Y2_9SPHI|nr:hypothetical protein [Sphingobacterium faecale]MBL1409368.1 hypothetical protein [Sphingobacterium faecale]
MAFQKGNIRLEGNIGDLNFYKSGDHYRVRQKSAKKTKNEISNLAPRSKENSQEFGCTSSFSKNLRDAFKNAIGQHYQLFQESSNLNRIVKRINLIVKADEISERGHRKVLPHNLMLLQNFSFNSNSSLKDTILIPIDVRYIRDTQKINLSISNLRPEAHLDIPKGIDSFMIHLTLFCINHQDMNISTEYTYSELLSYHHSLHSVQLSSAKEYDITDAETLIVAVGLSLYKDTAGYPVPQISPNLNCFDIIKLYPPSKSTQ